MAKNNYNNDEVLIDINEYIKGKSENDIEQSWKFVIGCIWANLWEAINIHRWRMYDEI